MKKLIFLIALLCYQISIAQLQSISETDGNELVVYSFNPISNPNFKEEDMLHLWMNEIFNPSHEQNGGLVLSNVKDEGYAKASVYLYDKTKPNGLGDLVYEVSGTRNSVNDSEYIIDGSKVLKNSFLNPQQQVEIKSTNFQRMLSHVNAKPYFEEINKSWINGCSNVLEFDITGSLVMAESPSGIDLAIDSASKCAASFGGGAKILPNGYLKDEWVFLRTGHKRSKRSYLNDLGCSFGYLGYVAFANAAYRRVGVLGCADNLRLPVQPLVVKLTLKNAAIRRLKLPVISRVDLYEFFPRLDTEYDVKLSVNNQPPTTIRYPQLDDEIPTLDMVMGDNLLIDINGNNNGTGSDKFRPRVYGLPSVWEAPFAGDMYFHCDPNTEPSTVTPFIGLDTRVHTLMLRPFPNDEPLARLPWEKSDQLNVALNKPTLVGEAYSNAEVGEFQASNGVDGITHSTEDQDLVHTTNDSSKNWWRVDLGGDYSLSEIRIYNRQSCCKNRLNGAGLYVADSNLSTPNRFHPNNLTKISTLNSNEEQIINIFSSTQEKIRYIFVKASGSNFLNFLELEAISESKYSWSYVAQRAMDPNITHYDEHNYFRWPKKHKNKDGTYKNQRQNQKEGLNMKFLYHWEAWDDVDFYGYDAATGKANYMMGFDDDELAYFGHPFKEVDNVHPLEPNAGIAKLETLQWKQVLEGETEYNLMGYPKNSPLNLMVNAHRTFTRTKQTSGDLDMYLNRSDYYGYEIQDVGTNFDHPNGNGGPNLAHPGLVTIDYGGKQVKFKLRVTNPLTREHEEAVSDGFYSAIVGPDAPAAREDNVPYYLKGVEGQPESEQKKYVLNYKWMDRLGVIHKKEISMYDILQDKGNKTWAQWSDNPGEEYAFNTEPSAYAWITATYESDEKQVIVAGKELNQIFLLFCGVKSLNGEKFPEGKGHGANIWLEDFRKEAQGEYVQARRFGNKTKYAKKNFKEYVFKKGDVVTFTTFDGDPHRLDNDEEEWYLSNRSIARRVKEDLLWNTENPSESYLKYYIKGINEIEFTEITTGRSGKDLTYTFSTPGEYNIKVSYREGSVLNFKVKVESIRPVDPLLGAGDEKTNDFTFADQNATIIRRDLTDNEKRWLDLSPELQSKTKILEIKDVRAEFAFKDGFRSYHNTALGNKLANRWSKYNDYSDAYAFFRQGFHDKNAMINITDHTTYNEYQTLIRSYLFDYEEKMRTRSNTWMWKDWANHYSSVWKGKLKVGDLDGLPPYTPNNAVTRLNELQDLDTHFGSYIDSEIFAEGIYEDRKKAHWQFVIPLASTTEYHGYRQRTNPSCIYDIRKVFDIDHGAFSGTPYDPNVLEPQDIQAPEVSDEIKNEQEFYYNLKYGRIVVIPEDFKFRVWAFNVLGKPYLGSDLPSPSNRRFAAHISLADIPHREATGTMKDATDTMKEVWVDPDNKIYPNQSTGLLTLSFAKEWVTTPGKISVVVHDLTGRKVFNQNLEATQKATINLSSLSDGVYIVNRSKGEMLLTDQVIIKK